MKHSIVVATALALAAVLLTGCAPGTPAPEPTSSLTPVESSAPSPDPTSVETAQAEAVPADLRANVIDAMNSGNTAALDGYLAPTVEITYAASENAGMVSDHGKIIDDLTQVTGDDITWDFDLPASLIENYRNNPGAGGAYTDDFPENALVGKSSKDYVLSFTVDGGLITRILFGDEYSLIFE